MCEIQTLGTGIHEGSVLRGREFRGWERGGEDGGGGGRGGVYKISWAWISPPSL